MKFNFDYILAIVFVIGIIRGWATGGRKTFKRSLSSLVAVVFAFTFSKFLPDIYDMICSIMANTFGFVANIFAIEQVEIGKIMTTIAVFIALRIVVYIFLSIFIRNYKRSNIAQIVSPASSLFGVIFSIPGTLASAYLLFFMISHVSNLSNAIVSEIVLQAVDFLIGLI